VCVLGDVSVKQNVGWVMSLGKGRAELCVLECMLPRMLEVRVCWV